MRLPTLFITALLLTPTMADEEETPLGKEMSALNDTMKQVKREQDPQQAAVLARSAQESLLASFSHVPALVAAMPDGPAKSQATAGYRRMLSEALTLLCKMEEAFLKGDLKTAESLRQQAHDLKLAAHERFIEQE